MKAMILAAGLGTRLLPLSKDRPKALIPVAGSPLLEIVLRRLIAAGFDEIIINAHHYAEQISDFIHKHEFPDIRIEISVEETLLDTGGGLKNAAWFFDDNQPFLLHNVDVLTDMDYSVLMNSQKRHSALATLAVRKRKSSRYLLFDDQGKLCGWKSERDGKVIMAVPTKGRLQEFAFSGIHVISPKLFDYFEQEDIFSIIDTYLKAAAQGAAIFAFPSDQWQWLDAGKLNNLQHAESLANSILAKF